MFTQSNRQQFMYNPVDYGFTWTDDGWYKWDREAARKAALRSRSDRVKQLRAEGWTVKLFTLKDQLISKGGIGSGNPHVEFVTSVYGFNAWK